MFWGMAKFTFRVNENLFEEEKKHRPWGLLASPYRVGFNNKNFIAWNNKIIEIWT